MTQEAIKIKDSRNPTIQIIIQIMVIDISILLIYTNNGNIKPVKRIMQTKLMMDRVLHGDQALRSRLLKRKKISSLTGPRAKMSEDLMEIKDGMIIRKIYHTLYQILVRNFFKIKMITKNFEDLEIQDG